MRRGWVSLLVGLPMLVGLLYCGLALTRPPRLSIQRPLFQGITYERRVLNQPAPLMVHIVTVNLQAPGVHFLVTPPRREFAYEMTKAQLVTDFVKAFDVQVGINANFFSPFYVHTPWDFYPHTGDPTDSSTLVIADGYEYAAGHEQWEALCIGAENRLTITDGFCPVGTEHAIAGNEQFIKDGQIKTSDESSGKYFPRTVVALDKSGETLWVIVVDGRQPFYSRGVTLAALAQILLDLGVENALNLDGGGSSTLVVAGDNGPKILNAPFQARIPMRQRPVVNHLGIYAQPIP